MSGHVRKRGKKWYYCFEVGTKDGKRKKIDRLGGNTKKEAQDALRKALNEYEHGFIEPTDLTLDRFIEEWMELFVTDILKKSTIIRYQSIIQNYISPSLGQLKIQKISPIQIETMISKYKKSEISKTTLQHIYSLTNNILNRAVKARMISFNPCNFVDRPTREKFRGDILSVKEFYTLIDALDVKLYRDYIFMIALHIELELGLRRGELSSLEWKNMNWEENVLSIENNLVYIDGHTYMTTPKSVESVRKLYISEDLKNLLASYKRIQNRNKLNYGPKLIENIFDGKKYDFILTWENGKGIHPSYYTLKIKRLMNNSSINKTIRFHDLRHTNATLLVSQGVDFKTIQMRLGHADINTTLNIYSHVSMDMQKTAVEKLTSHINGGRMAVK
jgi:integrase